MNKFIKALFMMALLSAPLSADNCSPCQATCQEECNPCDRDCNKTHMTPRSHGVNLALEYGDGWRDLIYRDCQDNYGANLQLAFFYEESTQGHKVGRYFSPCTTETNCESSSSSCNTSCTPVCETGCDGFTWGISFDSATVANQGIVSQDLNIRNYIQMPFERYLLAAAGDASVPTQSYEVATQGLKMDRQTYGFLLNYHQELDMLWKGLYFKVNLPIVHVENRIRCCLEGEDFTINALDGSTAVPFNIVGSDTETMIQDFLAGDNVIVPLNAWTTANSDSSAVLANVQLQVPLCAAQIDCGCETDCEPCPTDCSSSSSRKHHRKSVTGVADIDIQIGYNFLNKDCFHHTFAFGFTIPTGSGPKATRIWDAQVGYKNHWGVGFSCNGDVRIWGDKDQNLRLFHALNYRYLLSGKECRTLGLCGENWGQYQLIGKLGQALLIPAANLLTQKVHVTLGSQVDYIVGFNYVNGGFSIDLGYNLFYRDCEKICIDECGEIFTADTYALPDYNYLGVDVVSATDSSTTLIPNNGGDTDIGDGPDGSTGFQQGNRRGGTVDGAWLTDADIDKSVAETPKQLSHKIFAGVGYSVKQWDIPFLIGVGGSYEFSGNRSTLAAWGVNVKLAVAF